MPTISPKDSASPLLPGLREQVRRLERAHTAQRAGRSAVPLGLPEIDALLPERGLLTGALHEIEAGPTPSGRVAPHDGPALGFAAHMLGRFGEGTILWCRQPAIGGDALPYAPTLSALVRSGAPHHGDDTPRGGSLLGDGGRPTHAGHRRGAGRDARH